MKYPHIVHVRTSSDLGGHLDVCEECGGTKISYSGGLNSLGKWVNSRKNFFMPVKVLSSVLRGKFEYYLKRAKLDFYGDEAYLYDDTCFNNFLSSIYNKDWIVYCKPPFKDSSCVVCLNSPPCLAKNILATIL